MKWPFSNEKLILNVQQAENIFSWNTLFGTLLLNALQEIFRNNGDVRIVTNFCIRKITQQIWNMLNIACYLHYQKKIQLGKNIVSQPFFWTPKICFLLCNFVYYNNSKSCGIWIIQLSPFDKKLGLSRAYFIFFNNTSRVLRSLYSIGKTKSTKKFKDSWQL